MGVLMSACESYKGSTDREQWGGGGGGGSERAGGITRTIMSLGSGQFRHNAQSHARMPAGLTCYNNAAPALTDDPAPLYFSFYEADIICLIKLVSSLFSLR